MQLENINLIQDKNKRRKVWGRIQGIFIGKKDILDKC